jgi:hypothetical protein
MSLSNPLKNQITSVRNVPKLASIYGIAVYDSYGGKAIQMHTLLIIEGASPLNPQEKAEE